MSTPVLITFVLYLLAMLAIGGFFFKRTKSLAGYILGRRKLNKWVASLSAQASDMSGWLLLGLPGYAYMAGMESAWIAIGLAIGTYLNWKTVAKRLRLYTEATGDSITLPNYFASRFGDYSRALRVISAVFILIFFLIYTASGFVAGAKLFKAVFDLPYFAALLISVAVIISYTFLGGFMAVSWTDFFQGILMFLAIVTLPVLGLRSIGGVSAASERIRVLNPELLDMFTRSDGSGLTAVAVVSLMAWGLGYFGQPHILARFMAIKSADDIKPARRVAMIWVTVCLACAILVGLLGRVCLSFPLDETTSETVFMVMVELLTHPVVGGILLAAVLAAIMSTADSQLLVTSSALTEDLYHAWIRPEAEQRELLWVSRSAVMAVAVIACLVATDPSSSVLKLVAYAWAGFGATFGPLVILSLFWRRMTRRGAIAGILVGGITVILWKQIEGGIFDIYEIVPGFLFSVLAIVAVSLIDHPPPQEVREEFDRVRRESGGAVISGQ